MRVHSKSGRYIALLPDSLMGGFSVVVTESGVSAFNASWPCSRIPCRPIRFEFEANGDLAGIVGTNRDGEEMLALSQNAQEFGELAMEKRRTAIKRDAARDAAWRREIEAHG